MYHRIKRKGSRENGGIGVDPWGGLGASNLGKNEGQKKKKGIPKNAH